MSGQFIDPDPCSLCEKVVVYTKYPADCCSTAVSENTRRDKSPVPAHNPNPVPAQSDATCQTLEDEIINKELEEAFRAIAAAKQAQKEKCSRDQRPYPEGPPPVYGYEEPPRFRDYEGDYQQKAGYYQNGYRAEVEQPPYYPSKSSRGEMYYSDNPQRGQYDNERLSPRPNPKRDFGETYQGNCYQTNLNPGPHTGPRHAYTGNGNVSKMPPNLSGRRCSCEDHRGGNGPRRVTNGSYRDGIQREAPHGRQSSHRDGRSTPHGGISRRNSCDMFEDAYQCASICSGDEACLSSCKEPVQISKVECRDAGTFTIQEVMTQTNDPVWKCDVATNTLQDASVGKSEEAPHRPEEKANERFPTGRPVELSSNEIAEVYECCRTMQGQAASIIVTRKPNREVCSDFEEASTYSCPDICKYCKTPYRDAPQRSAQKAPLDSNKADVLPKPKLSNESSSNMRNITIYDENNRLTRNSSPTTESQEVPETMKSSSIEFERTNSRGQGSRRTSGSFHPEYSLSRKNSPNLGNGPRGSVKGSRRSSRHDLDNHNSRCPRVTRTSNSQRTPNTWQSYEQNGYRGNQRYLNEEVEYYRPSQKCSRRGNAGGEKFGVSHGSNDTAIACLHDNEVVCKIVIESSPNTCVQTCDANGCYNEDLSRASDY